MISFRFHVVSLAAVFLAMGLGVLTGTTVLNKGIVAQLEQRTDDLATQSSELRQAVQRLQSELGEWSEFGRDVRSIAIADRLAGTDVVLITQESTAAVAIEAARQALLEGGARVRAELLVEERAALASEEDVRVLASALSLPGSSERVAVMRRAAEAVADQLAFGATESDWIGRLVDAGFLVVQGPDAQGEGPLGGPDPVMVVVAGGQEEPAVEPVELLVPLVERLVLDGQTVVAAEPRESAYEFVTVLRNGDVAQRLATQDNLDEVAGSVGFVLALEALIDGRAGHYGVKPGASDLLPPVG